MVSLVYTESRDKSHYAEFRYAECYSAECHRTVFNNFFIINLLCFIYIKCLEEKNAFTHLTTISTIIRKCCSKHNDTELHDT